MMPLILSGAGWFVPESTECRSRIKKKKQAVTFFFFFLWMSKVCIKEKRWHFICDTSVTNILKLWYEVVVRLPIRWPVRTRVYSEDDVINIRPQPPTCSLGAFYDAKQSCGRRFSLRSTLKAIARWASFNATRPERGNDCPALCSNLIKSEEGVMYCRALR